MNPPLRLESYFYTKINVQAAPLGELPEPEGEKHTVTVDTKVSMKRNKENDKKWMVILNIHADSSSNKPIPYKVDLEMVGIFEVLVDLEKQKVARLIHVTGSSILYSAARELVLMLTGRGPWAPWSLPTTTFIDLKKESTIITGSDPAKNSDVDASKKEEIRAAE
ncbi:MAG: protein-export chaperone SecB [Candidatus Deferrimicrobium sp.]